MRDRQLNRPQRRYRRGLPAGPGPGHFQLAQHRLPPRRQHRGHGAARIPPDLPAARLGGARPDGDLADPAGDRARGAAPGRARSTADQGHRHHQPARDHRGVEPPHRPAHLQRHRLAGPARRAQLRRAARARLGRYDPRQDRLAHRRLFLRHQAPVDPGPRARGAPARRTRRAGLRHRGRLADLAAHRRPGSCDGRQQRLAHHALQRAREPLGRRTPGRAEHPAPAHARGASLQRGFRPHRARAAGRVHSHRRRGR